MARRGRPPKPTSLKRLQGNPGRRPLSSDEPQPPAGVPECPAWLNRTAKAAYHRLTGILAPLNVLTLADGEALTTAAVMAAEVELATKTLDKEGRYTVNAKGGTSAHPAHKILHSAAKLLGDYLSRFGLEPSARSRLHVNPPNPAVAELDAEFLQPPSIYVEEDNRPLGEVEGG
jgi:P27 family predicted phage terminase small subunit